MGSVNGPLKPGIVMCLPLASCWNAIEVGCAAHTRDQARLGFTLAYAAPVVDSAYRAGEHFMVAEVWEVSGL